MDAATLHAPCSTSIRLPARPLHVVLVDEELPYPPTSGKRIRALNLTLRLARRHRLTYLCHRNADADECERARTCFHDHGIETVIVDRTVPPKKGPAFYARLAANLLSPLPYSVASHNSRALRRAIADHAARNPVDLWQCEWSPYFEPLRCLPDSARRVVIAQNVESLIWRRYHENEASLLKRWYIGRQWRKFERFERRTVCEATRTVAVTPEDATLFRDFGASAVDVVDNGVDTRYFTPPDAPRDPDRILFLGSLDWRPNLDAVEQLLARIYPEVRRAHPAARFLIVGRNPPSWLGRRAESLPGVELHADVADVRPFLAASGVMVVPLRIGGGSRLKILEALASGLPVVSTRVGAEGLYLEPGEHVTVGERPEDLVPALLHCLRHPEPALMQAERGRQRVLERYDWDILADRLEQVWLDCVAPLAVSR